MRIYSNVLEAVKETERELHEMGTFVHPETYQDKFVKNNDDFDTKELQGYGFKLTSTNGEEEAIEYMKANNEYINKELSERLSPESINPGESWKIREYTWKQFLNANNKFSYTYNERFREQLPRLIEELRVNRGTRKAVLTMYDRHQDLANWRGIARIPCSMYYQFLPRTREWDLFLDVIYTMRSCDFYTHFIYDLILGLRLRDYVAGAIGIKPGHFTHFMGSLHAYKKDYDQREVF